MNGNILYASIVCLLFAGQLVAEEFCGYYTHIDSKEPFEKSSRTGLYSDIVVKIGDGRLVFWRGSSYLPYWETPKGRWFLDEVVPRKGDGTDLMPDRVNAFSYVDIVKNEADRIDVEWRYLPNFKGGNPPEGMDVRKFVEERFTISPSGEVVRTIKKGTAKFDDWQDPLNQTVIHLQLNSDGVKTLKTVGPSKTNTKPVALKGNPVKGDTPIKPSLHWSFDEGVGDQVKEDISGEQMDVAGHKTFWKKGVSGTALAFDGYNTEIEAKGDLIPDKLDGLTCTAWFTIGAYPWNIAPFVQKGEEDGFILGIGAYGKPVMHVRVNDRNEKVVCDKTLERNRWYHLAGVCDARSGKLQLFVNGALVQEKKIEAGTIVTPNSPVKIGKVKARPPIDLIRLRSFVSEYGFDGLMDEVSVFQKSLTPETVKTLYSHYNPGRSILEAPDMPARALPTVKSTGKFGAYYTHLKFYETWDALWRRGPNPDVVVEFENNPSKFIFWRGTGYIPMLVNESEQWYSNEFNETMKRSGGKGCQEPMSDKEGYSNHARIIENTPARLVVHWRYPLKDVRHLVAHYDPETGWADWSDWYYTIYPDGVAAKFMTLWTHGARDHEWQESMVILGPNQHPEQVIEKDPAIILADMNGRTTSNTWIKGPPMEVNYRRKAIQIVNYKGTYDPFTIGEFTSGDVYSGELTSYSVFPSWNHWPVSQITSDSRYARFPDRTAHSSLTHIKFPGYHGCSGDKPFYSKVMMEGMSDRKANELANLAKSWLQAPTLTDAKGCLSKGYIKHERAYHLIANAPKVTFTIAATPKQPIENLAVVVYNWNQDNTARVELNNQPVGTLCKQGIIRDPKGRQALVVWLEHNSTKPVSISITGAKPEGTSEFTDNSLKSTISKGIGMFSLTFKADMLHGVNDRKFMFECTKGMKWNSGWQIENRVKLHDLAPDTAFVFRFKVRDFYGNESQWSDELRYRTPPAPKPGILNFKDGFVIQGPADANAITIQKQGTVKVVNDEGTPSFLFEKGGHLVVNDGDRLESHTEFTWMAWFKTTKDGVLVSRADEKWSLGDNALCITGGKLLYTVAEVARKHDRKVQSQNRLNDGNWHHIAIRKDPTGKRRATLFIDGKNETRRDFGNQKQDPCIPIRIGSITSGDLKMPAFEGQLKDLRFYEYGVADEEIARIYGELKTP